jgi:glycosyltransferase involved in cell wall biosynthesis
VTEVTVVIPTRNRWPALRQTLASALAQEDVDVELVVIDDGSTDETARELGAFSDERVHFARHPSPLGPARARNAGIERATASWIAFLDDDDRWSPRKLRAQLDASGDSDFVYCSAIAVDPRGAVVDRFPAPGAGDLLRRLLARSAVPAGASNVLVRTPVVRALGGFDPSFSHLDDWDLWIRLAAAHSAACVPDVLVAHVHHPGNRIVAEAAGPAIAELDLLASRHAAISGREAVWPDRAEYVRWVAAGQRRAGRRRAAATSYLRAGLASRAPADVARAAAALVGVRRGPPSGSGEPAPAWARR